ncbi:hypothetical protein ACVMAJ_005114 [Bradyrhizobium sp. USDA 4448]
MLKPIVGNPQSWLASANQLGATRVRRHKPPMIATTAKQG